LDEKGTSKIGNFSAQFLLPAGQWLIFIGAGMVAVGLTINGRISAQKEVQGKSKTAKDENLI